MFLNISFKQTASNERKYLKSLEELVQSCGLLFW